MVNPYLSNFKNECERQTDIYVFKLNKQYLAYERWTVEIRLIR